MAERTEANLETRGGRVRLEKGSDEAYERLLEGRAEATFFHARAWARIACAAFPQLEDLSGILWVEGEPHALPLFRWRRWGGLVETLHSAFPFLYGGPVPATERAWRGCVELLGATRAAVTLIGNPFAAAPAEEPCGTPSRWLTRAQETTHLLALPATIEAYWGEVLTSRKRNDLRRLTQKGVAVEESRAPEDVAAVHALYRRRMQAWSRRPGLVYPLRFYEEMLARGGEAVRLYVARYAGRLIGGAFVVRGNGIVHYNAGYFDEEQRALRPNILIQERIIRDAIAEGWRLYDFLPSAGLESVESFKESMGGTRLAFPRWERTARIQRWARGLRGALRGRGGLS